MLFAFGTSPAAMGNTLTAAQLYKQTYIELKKGKNGAEVMQNLVNSARANGVEVKEVLEAAVSKGWMSQQQLNTVMDFAAKNTHFGKERASTETKTVKISKADLDKFAQALAGQVTGAAYGCGYYNDCYYNDGAALLILWILILAIVISAPGYFIVIY